jgi:hypothetical protein
MNWFRTICLLGIVLTISAGYGQPPRSDHDPAANRPSDHRESFIEFALRQINPQGKDYGQCLEDMRRTAIELTIDDYYYWSNLTAIVGLLVTFCVLLRQRTLLKRRELSTARVLCWYHNELFAARDQAYKLGAKYAELKREAEHQAEAWLVHKPTKTESAPLESQISPTEPALNPELTNEQALRETIKKMEQQAGRDKEILNSLRQQVSVLSRRLQEEQQKKRGQASGVIPAAGKQKDGNEGQRV